MGYGTKVKIVKGFTTDNTFEDRINEVLQVIEKEGNIILNITPIQVDINSVWILIRYEPDGMAKTYTIDFAEAIEKEQDDTKVYKVKTPPVQEPIFYHDVKTNEFEPMPVFTVSAAQ